MGVSHTLKPNSSRLTDSQKERGKEKDKMKKFSRMPKSESGGLGGASGSGCSSGVSSYFGKVFAVGRYQVTVEELVAEGMSACSLHHISTCVCVCVQ